MVGCFYAADYFAFNTQLLSHLYHTFSTGGIGKYFQTVAHVEDLVHLPVVGAGSLLYQAEDNGWLEQMVLDHLEITRQIFHTLGLPAPAAMDKTMYPLELPGQQPLQQRGIRSGGTQ